MYRRIMFFLFNFVSIYFLQSCSESAINGRDVFIDTSVTPFKFTYIKTGSPVTGKIIFYEKDPETGKEYKESIRNVIDGIRVDTAYNYDPNGNLIFLCPIIRGNKEGLAKYYYGSGQLQATIEMKNDEVDGVGKFYSEEGMPVEEIIYKEGKELKKYDFDKEGNKIIPAIEKLKLEQVETGFYEYVDYNSNQLLYQPIVKMKWKNISDIPLSESVKITGTFISNNEEWSNETDYFQGFTDSPLQPNLTRQSRLQSSTGFQSFLGIGSKEIYCNLFVNGELYKKLKIDQKIVNSNLIQ